MKVPGPLDAIAAINIVMYGSGQMSVSGNIGDADFALKMLDEAKDAVRNQRRRIDPKNGVIVPGRDVEAKPSPAFPLVHAGDLPPGERGDLVP